MSELRCPHCATILPGGNVYKAGKFHDKHGPWIFDCPSCQISSEVWVADKAEAIAAWNRREPAGWVSVEVRLPEIGQGVLIGHAKNPEWIGEALYTGEGWSGPGFVSPYLKGHAAYPEPTHWKPLPPPPDEPAP